MMSGKDYPKAYLDGFADFYYEHYKITEGVLIPRPDTELLVETALMYCGALENPVGDLLKIVPCINSKEIVLADLCTGSGCVGISTANALVRSGRGCEAYLIDIADEAIKCCTDNINECKAKCYISQEDIMNGVFILPERVDIITSNPPYVTEEEMNELPLSVRYEPALALYGGSDGLDFYDRLCRIGNENLKSGGVLAVEHGYQQQEAVIDIFLQNGYSDVTGLKDFGNNPRVVAGIRRG